MTTLQIAAMVAAPFGGGVMNALAGGRTIFGYRREGLRTVGSGL